MARSAPALPTSLARIATAAEVPSSARHLARRLAPMRLEGWVGEDAAGFEGLATLVKLAWLEPRALSLSLERSRHGTEVTVVRGEESAMLESALLGGPFEPLFRAVVEQVVPAPELATIALELATRVDALEHLEEVAERALAARTVEEVLDGCMAGALDVLGLARCALFARDDARGAFVLARAGSSAEGAAFSEAARAVTFTVGEAPSLEASAACFAPITRGAPAKLVPVASRGEVLGYALFDPIDADREARLERLLRQVAASWQGLRLLSKVEAQSRHDPVTGLAHRRELLNRLTHERSRALRMKMPLGLLLVELDALDGATQEEVRAHEPLLKAAAAIFRAELRAHDLAGRFDEARFAVILPGAGAFEAALVARRLGLAALGKDLSLSMGATSFPDDCDHPDDLVGLATAHLEAAVTRGRGRACLSRDGDPIVFAEESDPTAP